MAKGYWNVAGSITNPAGMGAYISAAEPYLEKCGARFLCRDLNTDVREGNPGHLTVIIEFESFPAAKAAYEAASAVLYLASSLSNFTTGQIITIDGGRTLTENIQVSAY